MLINVIDRAGSEGGRGWGDKSRSTSGKGGQ
jgi:hypothetical protein